MSAITSTIEEKSNESSVKQMITKSHDFLFNLFYQLGIGTSTSKMYVLQLIALLFPNDNMLIPWSETSAGDIRAIVQAVDYVRNFLQNQMLLIDPVSDLEIV